MSPPITQIITDLVDNEAPSQLTLIGENQNLRFKLNLDYKSSQFGYLPYTINILFY